MTGNLIFFLFGGVLDVNLFPEEEKVVTWLGENSLVRRWHSAHLLPLKSVTGTTACALGRMKGGWAKCKAMSGSAWRDWRWRLELYRGDSCLHLVVWATSIRGNVSLHFRFKNLMCKELMGEAENNVFLGSSLLIELCFLRPAVFGTSHTYSFFLRA